MWFDVQAAYKEVTGQELPTSRPETSKSQAVGIRPATPPTIKTQSTILAPDLAGLSYREQAICNLVAKGNRRWTNGDTVTHALIDRLIERGRVIQGKGGAVKANGCALMVRAKWSQCPRLKAGVGPDRGAQHTHSQIREFEKWNQVNAFIA
ncbi:hypothetical protein [Halocynthiibacter sp.]|uniref:hypothetical protein n=1 Tax=Halocynthiibacter sp. TaxID=1979210 RepID=UPI003C60636F